MDLLKLLNSLEDLVVEVALWFILLPRTLFAAVFTPVKLAKYFDHMQTISPEERNDEYLSPVLFWILVAPASWMIALARMDKEALALYGDAWEERLATAVLMLLGPPLGFALAAVLVRREGVSRNSLRRHFALQCYFHAPMVVLFVLLLGINKYVEMRFSNAEVSSTVLGGLILPVIAWFLVTEFRVAMRETDPGRAGGSVALGCCLGLPLMFALALAITLLFFLIGRTPGFGR